MAKGVDIAHGDFNSIWTKVETRYETETGLKLHISKHEEFVAYLRKFPEVNKQLPEYKPGEGQSIYRAYLDSRKPEKNSPYIKLLKDYINALRTYAEGNYETDTYSYNNYLKSFYTKNGLLGNKNLNLKDLYIQPTVYNQYVKNDEKLEIIIINWLTGNNEFSTKYDNLVLILGDPGQGKTSFCYSLLYNIIGKISKSIYLCRLRYINDIEEFYIDPYTSILKYLQKYGYINEESKRLEVPISEASFKESILILDGLDELEKINGSSKDTLIHRLASGLIAKLSPYKVIVTSRKDIDYRDLERNRIRFFYLTELEVADQIIWLDKYNSKTNNSYVLTHEELDKLNNYNSSTYPLMRQPILLSLMAQANIHPDIKYNSSKLYDELFATLFNRYWNSYYKYEDEHPVLNKYFSSPNELRSTLQSIGFQMYKLNTTYLNYEQLPASTLKNLGLTDNSNLEAIRTLIISFYFNYQIYEEGYKKKYAVEFLHKTFGEFFAAEKIWLSIKELFDSDQKSDDVILDTIVELFDTDTYLPNQIIFYIQELITNDTDGNKNGEHIQSLIFFRMNRVVSNLLDRGFWNYSSDKRGSITGVMRIFYGFLNIYRRLSPKKTLKLLDTSDEYKLCNFIRFLSFHESDLNFYALNFVGFQLMKCRFRKTNFNKSVLNYANLKYCSLEEAILLNASLIRSHFEYSQIINTRIENSDFSFSDMSNIMVFNSNISDSNFSNCNLTDGRILNSKIKNCSFFFVDLNKVVFTDTEFIGVSFLNANGMSVGTFLNVKTLNECTGIPEHIIAGLKEMNPIKFRLLANSPNV